MDTKREPNTDVAERPPERRGGDRLQVVSRLESHSVGSDAPVALMNLSLGGFLMLCPISLPVGTIDDFRFTSAGNNPIILRAQVRHTMMATSGDAVTYVIGLEFINRDADGVSQAIEDLVAVSGN